jgi:hypothetical protein
MGRLRLRRRGLRRLGRVDWKGNGGMGMVRGLGLDRMQGGGGGGGGVLYE